MKALYRVLVALCAAFVASAFLPARAADMKIAVADLAYEQRVSQYFRVVAASSSGKFSASQSERETPHTYSERSRARGEYQSSYAEAEGTYSYIERGELRNYTADLKGALIKGGGVKLVQAKPYTSTGNEKLFDVISRIKQGYFPGADYVLFGVVSNLEFKNELSPLQGTSSATSLFGLDLVVDFSLVNTKTYQVKAAFSAMGSGQDVKIVSNRGDVVVPARGKVVMETSRSLAENAYGQILEQFGVAGAPRTSQPTAGAGKPVEPVQTSPVTVFR